MITNKKLYEMIAEQMNAGNEDLREQLKAQIADKTAQSHTMAQELADKQSQEISLLSAEISQKFNALQSDLHAEMHNTAENYSEIMIQKLTQEYDAKLENVKTELLDKLEENFSQMMNASKSLSDGIANLQKDTAVIMETLQLILTNMMLDNVEAVRNQNQ